MRTQINSENFLVLINQGDLVQAATLIGDLMMEMGPDEPALIEAQTIIRNRGVEEVGLMKRCPKTQPEPAILKAYRTANPASNWDQMKNEDPECYNALRKALYRDQGGLCAYCEINLESKNTQIGHFHPKSDKSGQHSWAFDWDNL